MRKKVLVTALGLALCAGGAQAALQAVDPGPYTAATGFFPLYYTDTNNTTLDLCLSKAQSSRVPGAPGAPSYMCSLLPNPGIFDDAQPIVFPVNFPDEAFYFTADAIVQGQGINLLYIAHLEAAFAAGAPAPGDQITFARIRVRADIDVTVPGPGDYRVTHPYGVEIFTAVSAGRRVINVTRDIGVGAAGDFTGALRGDIGPFLRGVGGPYTETNPETGALETFVGDPNLLEQATGSPFGTNFVQVQRIDAPGIDVSTDLFAVSGRMWNGQRPTTVAVERASYSRTVNPDLTVTTRIDGFATSTPTATVCFRETLDLVGGTNPCQFTMTGDGTGKFFAQDPAVVPPLPPYIVVTASDPGDPLALPPRPATTPTPIAQSLADLLKVTKAQYARDSGTLVIEATSSDQAAPPKITAVGLGVLNPIPGTVAGQRLQLPLPGEPPAFVTLVSSGGGRHTEPVTVVAAAAPNQAPVANPDSFTTPEDTAVTVNVLANDSDPDNVPPTPANAGLSVTGVSGATGGAAVLNANGTVTFTPTLNFNGIGGFNYAISDGNGGTASAHVTVTVTPVNDAPTIDSTPVTNASVGVQYSYLVSASDVDGDTLSYALTTAPAGMTISPSGLILWTPTAAQVGANPVTVRVTDNGTPALSATQSFTVNVVQPAAVDLDIAGFSVTNRVTRPGSVSITLRVRNGGTVDAPRPATVTGVLNGVTVYNVTVPVSDPVGGGSTTFGTPVPFPALVLPAGSPTGTINWTATIADDNPDLDRATATTTVR